MSKSQLDEFRKDFFKSYLDFLKNKAGVNNATEADTDMPGENTVPYLKLGVKGKHKRMISQGVMKEGSNQSLSKRMLISPHGL